MVLFNSKNKIQKYNTIEEIVNEFYDVRLDFYKQRKTFLLSKLGFALEKNQNKKKFINMVLEGELPFKGTKNKKEDFKLLKSKTLSSINELKKKYKECFQVKSTEIVTEKTNEENDENANNNADVDVGNDDGALDYDYLMNMNIWSLTHEKVLDLEEQIKNQTKEYEYLKKSKPEDLWKEDLEEFIKLYKKIINGVNDRNKEAEQKIEQHKSKTIVKGKNRKPKKNSSEKNININNSSKNTTRKKNSKKNDYSFIVSDDDIEEEILSESIESSSSSVSSEEINLEPDGNYTIISSSPKKKRNNKSAVKSTVKEKDNKNKVL